MRIALVTRVWPTQRPGGMPHVCQDRAVELARQGYDVHVVTTWCSPVAGAVGTTVTKVEAGVHVHYTSAPAHEWTPEFAGQALKKVAVLAPDLIHSESFDRSSLWWEALPQRPRVAITMHGFAWGAWITKWNLHRGYGKAMDPFPADLVDEEEAGLASADVVCAVSRWEWRLLRDQYGLRTAVHVPNPIHPAFFSPRNLRHERTCYLCVGVAGAHTRGFRVADDACKRTRSPLYTASKISRDQMPAVYDGARAVLLPTAYAQGYDLTIAEGRARGIPAIMTPTGSYLDHAEPWDTFMEMGDTAGLASILEGYDPPPVPEGAADMHRPEEHVWAWLQAVTA